ncbi:Ankyrin-3 [Araneus ventricosus]|uniref:Alpha-latrotoxin n=1 Tax=Araneus ventricosus TaxID=182803 RepID=A0A4Y2FGK7_ARAVE|nr:Ankyrin-3 [Araneus ventricosus]
MCEGTPEMDIYVQTLLQKSDDEIAVEFSGFDEEGKRNIYLNILFAVKNAILKSDHNTLQKLSCILDSLKSEVSNETLKDFYNSTDNPFRNTNAILLASKHSQIDAVRLLFEKQSRTLCNLNSKDCSLGSVLPDTTDGECHNVFYYAIRSGKTELLRFIVEHWPNEYFQTHTERLDTILSDAYNELKLKNILLPDEMEVLVRYYLIEHRFFNESSNESEVYDLTPSKIIKERIDMLLEAIENLLKTEFLEDADIFLLEAKFIAKIINVLKRLLKMTYDKLPWEEIEFCLVLFVRCNSNFQKRNFFYNSILTKSRILSHLKNFAHCLSFEKSTILGTSENILSKFPKNQKRDDIVSNVLDNRPYFKGLYVDYKKIRDMHSLENIEEYIDVALSADPEDKEGQMALMRALQVIGEHLKNTIETPKLTDSTSELLLYSLPATTRDVIKDLRDNLSHSKSLSMRSEIKKNNSYFFAKIQNDLKKLDSLVTEILYRNETKIIVLLLNKIFSCKDLKDIRQAIGTFDTTEARDIILRYPISEELEQLEILIDELSKKVVDKTYAEEELFNAISFEIDCEKNKISNAGVKFLVAFNAISCILSELKDDQIDEENIQFTKVKAEESLLSINMIAMRREQSFLREINDLLRCILDNIIQRIGLEKVDDVITIAMKIFHILEYKVDNIKWIEEFRYKLKQNYRRKEKEEKEDKYKTQFHETSSLLKDVLEENGLLTHSSNFIQKLSVYKNDKNLQAAIEMIVLDAYSILSTKGHLTDNPLYAENKTTTLIGKNLRNHLAHFNALNDILTEETILDTALNAAKIKAEVTLDTSKKIDRVVLNDHLKMKSSFHEALQIIHHQKALFSALAEGNLPEVKNCLIAGADLLGRDMNSWTALHCASKGPNLEVVRFVLDQGVDIEAKDSKGFNVLHVASSFGRAETVKFFLEQKKPSINEETNDGQTPLHLAIQYGHKVVVQILLQNNACTSFKSGGSSPLWYAVWYDRKDIVEILLERIQNVNADVRMGGYTSLHVAAEKGHTELVNFLLEKGASVNKESDEQLIPLHLASMRGNAEIVSALLSQKSDVNAETIDGHTPLIFAAERDRFKVAELLIKRKAKVNVADKTLAKGWTPLMLAVKNGSLQMTEYLLKNNADLELQDFLGQTALHFAVLSGSESIVDILLRNKADISVADNEGKTALHKAAERGSGKIVRILIQKGSDINAEDINKRTPLHCAAEKGFLEVVKVLTNNRALKIDAKDADGSTALHLSMHNKHRDIIKHLIDCRANINELDSKKRSPLHLAIKCCNDEIMEFFIGGGNGFEWGSINGSTLLRMSVIHGNKRFAEELINNGYDVLVQGEEGCTLLSLAAESNQLEIVKFLVKRMSHIFHWKDKNGHSPLYYAVKNNYKKIVLELIRNGISAEENESLEMTVRLGYKDILDILLKKCNDDFIYNLHKFRLENGFSLLHLASVNGHLSIVETLLKFGAEIDATVDGNGMTALHLATKYGHTEIMEVLVEKKADVDIQSVDGQTPLHLASADGSTKMIEILLNGEAKLSIRDKTNKLPVELATANRHLYALKILLENQYKNFNNLLHIAAGNGDLEIAKYLIGKNCDLHFRDSSDRKPVHVAAQHGYLDVVKLFLTSDESLKDNTLLHLAVSGGHLELVRFLIDKKVYLNAPDEKGDTPVHLAAIHGNKNILEILLYHGACYDSSNNSGRRAKNLAQEELIRKALQETEKLFKSKFPIDVELCIERGAFVNSKRSDGNTPLHFAAWKGFEWMVKTLLDNGANPNMIGKKGSTPLHYACKYAPREVVEVLLANGGMYNALNDVGKTPIQYAEREDIKELLNILDKSFKGVQDACVQAVPAFLRDLKRARNIRSFMRAKNRSMKTLVVAAISNDFPFIEQLKLIQQDDPSDKYEKVEKLMEEEKFEECLTILREMLEGREAVLGSDNPGCFDIQEKIAMVLYKQQKYKEAMEIFDDIYKQWKEALHVETEDTLRIRGLIAATFHRQGDNKQALDVFNEIEVKMKNILGEDHGEYLKIQTHKAAVLHALGKYEDALRINGEIYEKYRIVSGEKDPLTLTVENNIGIVLKSQGKKEEALRTFGKVYEGRKNVLGKTHSDTLRTLHNMVGVLSSLEMWEQAHKAYEDVLTMQRDILGENHLDTLRTQTHIGDLYFYQGNYLRALKIYLEGLDKRKAKLGHDHPEIIGTEEKILSISQQLFLDGIIGLGRLNQVHLNVSAIIEADSMRAIENLIRMGMDINCKDSNGRSLLHFAVNDNKKDKVISLLSSGADVFAVSAKGNTPLHIAASKGLSEIAEILLDHVKQHHSSKLNDFINAKTTAKGSTALHVAANERTAKILLKYGAIYNLQNNFSQTPAELAKNWHIIYLLRLTDRVFKDAARCNSQLILEISMLLIMGFSAVFFARNRNGLTLLEVAQEASNKVLEYVLSEMMKTPNHLVLTDSKILLL